MAESFSLGEAVLGTSVDTSGLKKGLGTSNLMTKKAMGKVGKNATSGLDNIARHASGVAGKVAKSASGMVSSFAALGPVAIAAAAGLAVAVAGIMAMVAAAKLAAKAVKKVTTALANMARSGVEGNKLFEQYGVQFTVLLGSESLALERLKELDEFGRKTPFELPGVVEADRIMQGFGLHAADAMEKFGFSGDEIRRIAGDVAAGTGVAFTDMANNLGKFSAGATGIAIQRFQELGVVTRDQLSAMGVEFSKSGELLSPMPIAMEALLTIMDEKYGGMMDAQSATLAGMLSNIQDWVDSTLRAVSKPIFDVFKQQVANLLTFLESPQAQGAIQNITNLLSNLFGLLTDFTNSFNIGPFIARLTGGLSQGIAKISQFVATLRAVMSGFGAGDIANKVAIDIGARQSALGKELSGLAAMNATTIANLEGQIANAASSMESSMGQIAERFAEQAAGIQEKFAEAKIRNEKAVHDKIVALEETRAAIREKLQENLAKLDEKFADKRTSLLEKLKFAETEADRLELEGRLALLGEEQQAEEDKLKTSAQKEQDKLTAQYSKELAALAEKILKEEAMRDKQFGKLAADQAKQEQVVIESYNTQVAALEQSITSQNNQYADQSAQLQAQAQADIDAIQERGFATANSLTTPLAKSVAKIKELGPAVDTFFGLLAAGNAPVESLREALKLLVPPEVIEMFDRMVGKVETTVDWFKELKLGQQQLTGRMNESMPVLASIERVFNTIIDVVAAVVFIFSEIVLAIDLISMGVKAAVGEMDALIKAFKDIFAPGQNFLNVMRKIETVAEKMTLPTFLMPGSPSPFENSLRGIGEAMSALSAVALPDLAASLGVVGLDRDALLSGGVSNSTSSEVNYNLQVITNAPSEPIIDDFRMLEAFQGAG